MKDFGSQLNTFSHNNIR